MHFIDCPGKSHVGKVDSVYRPLAHLLFVALPESAAFQDFIIFYGIQATVIPESPRLCIEICPLHASAFAGKRNLVGVRNDYKREFQPLGLVYGHYPHGILTLRRLYHTRLFLPECKKFRELVAVCRTPVLKLVHKRLDIHYVLFKQLFILFLYLPEQQVAKVNERMVGVRNVDARFFQYIGAGAVLRVGYASQKRNEPDDHR